MRGISFEVYTEERSILATVLEGIDINSFYWSISEDEIYMIGGKDLFEEKQVDGKEFLNKIIQLDYSVIFANIKGYTDKSISGKINYYNDFLNSNCELIILCYDVFFYEIYSKSEKVIEIIKSNCIKKGYEEIQYITEETDCRAILSIM
jgi:hypothetical protein